MKKILFLAIVLMCTLLPVKLWAQVEAGSPYKIWTDPVVYRASDQVTWYFDMTDTKFKAGNYRRRPTSKAPVRWYSRANIIWQ